MKRSSISQTLILALVLVFGCFVAFAQDQAAKTIKKVNAQPTTTLNGADLFKEYCAVCHGSGAKGDGPAADALKKRPADLTQLSRKNGGSFPELHVMNYIKGQDVLAAHGSRDMPIWGQLFHSMNKDAGTTQLRVSNLTDYVKTLQAK